MLKVNHIRINRLHSPKLVDPARVTFGWQLSSDQRNCLQSAFQLAIFAKDTKIFDTGRVESDQSVDIFFSELTLTHKTNYRLTLTLWDNHGESAQGEAFFSTALSDRDWQEAKWITPKKQIEGVSPFLRRKFEAQKPMQKATLYASGLGLAEFYLNGEKISDHYIDPIATNYEKTVFYRAYDVSDKVVQGGNALAVWLGDGFWGQNRLWLDHAQPRYGEVCCIALLEILYADGTKESIVTDPDAWQAKASPIALNNLYAGEIYDARFATEDFALYEGDEEGWGKTVLATVPEGKLTGCDLPAVKVIETIPAVSVTTESGEHDGAFVFDFGKNFAGIFTVKIPPSPPGATYVFRMAETLCDGHPDYRTTGSYATECVQQDIYIAKGDPNGESYTPRFTYHGFQYIEVTGFYTLGDGYGALPDVSAIVGLALSTEMEETGDFQTDYEPLKKLFDITKHTFRANYHGFPEDCPAREKCGWLGDAHAVCDFGLLNFDTAALYEKYMDDIATTREVYGGLTMISPGRRGCGEATPLWGCAQILIPFALWEHMGDKEVILRHLPLMHLWVDEQVAQSDHLILKEGLGDWLPPVGNESPLRMPVSHSSTLMLYEICDKMERICLTFAPEKVQHYHTLKEATKKAFIAAFYSQKEHTYGYIGTDGVALALGVYPEGEQEALSESLAKGLESNAYQMTTAIYATKYLVPVLLSSGLGKEAITMLFSEKHPSFGTMMGQGATTLWERLEMRIPEPDKNNRLSSLNHPMHGGFLYSLYTHLAGISPKAPGYKVFAFSPAKNSPVDFFDAHFTSPYGQIKVVMEQSQETIYYTLTIPENSQAVLAIEWAKFIKIDQTPAQNGQILGSGTYHITVTK